MSRDIFGYHSGGKGTSGLYWAEARYAAKHPTMNTAGPTKKNYPFQNVSGARIEKP